MSERHPLLTQLAWITSNRRNPATGRLWSKKALGEAVGKSRSWMGELFAGRIDPAGVSYATLVKLSDVTALPIEQFTEERKSVRRPSVVGVAVASIPSRETVLAMASTLADRVHPTVLTTATRALATLQFDADPGQQAMLEEFYRQLKIAHEMFDRILEMELPTGDTLDGETPVPASRSGERPTRRARGATGNK